MQKAKACVRGCPLPIPTFRKVEKCDKTWLKADMVEHESQDQSASVGKFSLTEAGKHTLPREGFFSFFL